MIDRPSLSVVIPVYNEEQRIAHAIGEVQTYLHQNHPSAELILVDDGSTDHTRRAIIAAAQDDPKIIPVLCPRNRGKGAALRAGIARTNGEYTVFFDADLAYPLTAVETALKHLKNGAKLAIGARDLSANDSRKQYAPVRFLTTFAFNQFVERVLGLGIKDTQCGFKAFQGDVGRALFDALSIDGFGFDVELLFLAQQWDLRIVRFALAMKTTPYSSVHVVRDSARMARDILSVRARHMRGLYPRRTDL